MQPAKQVNQLRFSDFVFAFVLVIGTVVGTLSIFNASTLASLADSRTHNREKTNALVAVTTLLKDAQSSQQRYLLTGNSADLRLFEKTKRDFKNAIAHLSSLPVESSTEGAFLAETADLIESELRERSETVALKKKGEAPAALKIINSENSRQRNAQIDANLAKMAAQHEARALETITTMDNGIRSIASIVLAVSLFRVLFVIVAWTATRIQTTKTLKALSDLAKSEGELKHLNAELERLVEKRTSDLAESHEHLKLLMDNVDDVIWMATGDRSKFLMINRSFEKMYGIAIDEIQKDPTSFMRVVHPDDRAKMRGIQSYVPAQPSSIEFRIQREGEIRFIRAKTYPIRNDSGEVYRIVGVATDITETRRASIAERDARESARIKAEFLANMSHEIRTPMNGIIGMATLLESQTSDPVVSERLAILRNCGESLLHIINDILDFSKIEAKKVELESKPLNLDRMVHEIVELFSPRAAESGVSLTYSQGHDVPTWIRGDQLRLRQILSNLVSNAVKFTERGTIKIESRRSDQGTLIFAVRDTGIGIPKHLQEKLFVSFSQADSSTTRRFGGTGLGLAISKGLCEKMQGRMWLESEELSGATFFFEIPLVECAPAEVTRSVPKTLNEAATLANRHPLRILVVEDNRINQAVASGLLGAFGYRIDLASDGYQAIEKLRQKDYDLVFMDCHMPVMDGFEVTRFIINEFRKRPRIVALSASTLEEDIRRCRETGMDSFLAKPVTIEALAAELKATVAISEFDSDDVVKNFSGLADLAKEVAVDFIRLSPAMTKTLKDAVEAQDLLRIRGAAHNFKGAVSNFHVELPRRTLERIEQSQDIKEIEALLADFENQLGTMISMIESGFELRQTS